jgi:hypothetical protein
MQRTTVADSERSHKISWTPLTLYSTKCIWKYVLTFTFIIYINHLPSAICLHYPVCYFGSQSSTKISWIHLCWTVNLKIYLIVASDTKTFFSCISEYLCLQS